MKARHVLHTHFGSSSSPSSWEAELCNYLILLHTAAGELIIMDFHGKLQARLHVQA